MVYSVNCVLVAALRQGHCWSHSNTESAEPQDDGIVALLPAIAHCAAAVDGEGQQDEHESSTYLLKLEVGIHDGPDDTTCHSAIEPSNPGCKGDAIITKLLCVQTVLLHQVLGFSRAKAWNIQLDPPGPHAHDPKPDDRISNDHIVGAIDVL